MAKRIKVGENRRSDEKFREVLDILPKGATKEFFVRVARSDRGEPVHQLRCLTGNDAGFRTLMRLLTSHGVDVVVADDPAATLGEVGLVISSLTDDEIEAAAPRHDGVQMRVELRKVLVHLNSAASAFAREAKRTAKPQVAIAATPEPAPAY
ncbi:MAG: hypothetical protein LBC95_00625 [Candidatus Nomurabacteria bacterium]|nr:hypothetical protein [Candidatus Nomurabacteria bacterium]